MMTTGELHDESMRWVDLALAARQRGDAAEATECFRSAFALELVAAMMLVDQVDQEPSRSILLQSAAKLALECGEFQEADRLASLVRPSPAESSPALRGCARRGKPDPRREVSLLVWQKPSRRPTEPGHYWVKVSKCGQRYLAVVKFDYLLSWLQPAYRGEVRAWAGPIPEPKGDHERS